MLSHFTRVWLCDPMDYSPPGSSVLGILQERTLEWIAMPSSRGSSQPRDQTHVSFFDILFFFFFKPRFLMSPALAGGYLPLVPPGKLLFCLLPCESWDWVFLDSLSVAQWWVSQLLILLSCLSPTHSLLILNKNWLVFSRFSVVFSPASLFLTW